MATVPGYLTFEFISTERIWQLYCWSTLQPPPPKIPVAKLYLHVYGNEIEMPIIRDLRKIALKYFYSFAFKFMGSVY